MAAILLVTRPLRFPSKISREGVARGSFGGDCAVPFEGEGVEHCTTRGSGSHKGTFYKVRIDDLCGGHISLQLPESFMFSVPYAN